MLWHCAFCHFASSEVWGKPFTLVGLLGRKVRTYRLKSGFPSHAHTGYQAAFCWSGISSYRIGVYCRPAYRHDLGMKPMITFFYHG
ncbi:hypothetical protein V8F06_000453 [Rhypophila decipiens]